MIMMMMMMMMAKILGQKAMLLVYGCIDGHTKLKQQQ
jgi:hypothetical protein